VAEPSEGARGFVPLARLLRPVPITPSPPPQATEAPEEASTFCAQPAERDTPAPEEGRALAHLRAAEWFERARELLLRRFARDVLGRELLLAPADIEALARRALAAFADDLPRAVAVAPADADRLDLRIPVRVEAQFERGDLAVEVSDGRLVSSLQLRVEGVIADVLAEAAVA
jgi:hypothetical protein